MMPASQVVDTVVVCTVVVGIAVGMAVVGIAAEVAPVLAFDKVFESFSVLDHYYTDLSLDHYIDLYYCYYFCTFIYLLKLAPPILGILSIVSTY